MGPGHNYRPETLQAAILNVKLQYLPKWTESRRRVAKKYCELLEGCGGVQLPKEREANSHVYHLYVIQADGRDALKEHLEKKEIGTGMHYPIPLHMQPCFQ